MMKRSGILVAVILLAQALAWGGEASQKVKGTPVMKDFIGINAHTVQFKPDLYSPTCRLVRDYHPIAWDLMNDTSVLPEFPMAKEFITWEDISGKWKSFSAIPNWKEIYGSWQKEGFEIDASLMLIPFEEWKNPAEDAYNYGKAFAEYFGPSGANKLVTSAEIGNEPAAEWKVEDYKIIFENMARGLRAGDPKLTILTATTMAGKADNWSLPVDIFKDYSDLYDVINVHVYSFSAGWPTWKRSYPEDPGIIYLKTVRETLEWRDKNAPGKELWVTEFGYDCSTKPNPEEGNFKEFEGVSDEVQAQWLVRSYLEFAALGVDRAYVYWFNDDDVVGIHAASGITRLMKPKMSYWAIKHLYETLGNYKFNKAIEQTVGQRYVYEFVNAKDANDCVWVIWSPTGSQRKETAQMTFPGKVTKAERMPMTDGPAEAVEVENLEVTESPVYVHITKEAAAE